MFYIFMKLDNYLNKLEDESVINKKECICLYGCSSIIKSIYLDIKKSNKRNTVKFIKEYLEVPYPTLYSWVSGSNPIPISKVISLLNMWKNVCLKDNNDVSMKLNELYYSSTYFSQNGQRKVILPKYLDSELGYIIGFFQGDGHIKKENKKGFQEYSIYFYEASKDMLDKINILIFNKFGIYGNIYFQSNNTGKWYSLRVSSKPIYLFFIKILGLQRGKKVRNISVPKIIKNAKLNIQFSFIRGFFDAEGGVGKTRKSFWLDIGQASVKYPSEILIWIKEKLEENDTILTNPQKSSNQDFFRIRTSDRETIKRFYHLIGSNHSKKLIRFKEIIQND